MIRPLGAVLFAFVAAGCAPAQPEAEAEATRGATASPSPVSPPVDTGLGRAPNTSGSDPATADTGPQSVGVAFVGSPEVATPAAAEVHLVRWLTVETTTPATVALAIDDGDRVRDVAFPDAAPVTAHELPVLGLRPGQVQQVTVTATALDGSTVSETVAVDVPALPMLVPDIALHVGAPAGSTPGYTLMAAWSPDVEELLLVVDDEGHIVWVREADGDPKAAMLWPDGRLTHLFSHNLAVHTMMGEIVATYSDGPIPGAIALDDSLHHDAFFPGDGTFWSLRSEPLRVPDYPVDETDPTVLAPATLVVDHVVHHDEAGTRLGDWSVAELLDTQRVGYGSADANGVGQLDWSHANAVFPVDGGAAFVVSLRHQDALVKVDATSGEVRWILANPDGWNEELDALRLVPVGTLEWPYHAHGVKVEGDLVYVFDNGNEQRTTPYSQSPHPDGLFSRLVAYRVDEVAGTVEQVVDIRATSDGPLFSRALGNVQVVSGTGHLLGTFSYLVKEHGVVNTDIGRGTNSTRLVEFDAVTGEVVWDLSLSGEATEAPKGWLVDRATRLPSLYLGLAEETWR